MKIAYLNLILFLLSTLLFNSCSNKIDEAYELKKLGLKDKAVESLNKIINEDPKNAEAYFALGNVYAELGNFKGSYENFQNALKLEPKNTLYLSRNIFLLLSNLNKNKNDIALEKQILSLINNEPNNLLGYSLLSRLYGSQIKDNIQLTKEYFNNVSKLNELKPLSNWQYLYSNINDRTLTATNFIVLKDSVEFFTNSGESAGYFSLGKNSLRVNIKTVKKDSIFFVDYDNISLKQQKAWRLDKVTYSYQDWGKMTEKDYPLRLDNPDALYAEPLATYYNSKFKNNLRKNSYDESKFIAPLNTLINEGSIIPTGRASFYKARYGEMGNLYAYDANYYWMEVSYEEKIPFDGRLSLSQNILLFKNYEIAQVYEERERITIDREVLINILASGYIANNMTPELVNISLDLSNNIKKIEFNRDNFMEFYFYGPYTLIFIDGLLQEINLRDQSEYL